VILGHHAHLPGSIEIYKERPIFYSLGNFCFGHDHATWSNNVIVRLVLRTHGVSEIELTPIAGSQLARYQPTVLVGEAAREMHAHMARISEQFGTHLVFDDDRSHITLLADRRPVIAAGATR
jgi:poly-gamma-glutamate capsule biosynthesis protein CapA/YwtB (metallophosphatase superfamily)